SVELNHYARLLQLDYCRTNRCFWLFESSLNVDAVPSAVIGHAVALLRPIIQLGIMPKDPFLIERQAPLGREIVGEPGARCESVVQRDHASVFGFLLGH